MDLMDNLSQVGDENRQITQTNRMAMYYDDFGSMIEERIKSQFTAKGYANLKPLVRKDFNLFKLVHDKRAVTYDKEAARKYLIDGTENEQFSELLSESNLNKTMPIVDLWANINNIAFVRVVARNGGLEFDPVPPQNIQVYQSEENPSEYDLLCHEVFYVDSAGSYKGLKYIYTNGKYMGGFNSLVPHDNGVGHYYVFNQNWEMLKVEGNEENINPFKDSFGNYIIPYQAFRIVETEQFWNETIGSDLYEATLNVGVNLTHKNQVIKYMSYKDKYITGQFDPKSLSSDMTSDVAVIKTLPTSNPAGSVDIQTIENVYSIDKLDESIIFDVNMIASVYGVNVSAMNISKQKSSAEAISMSRKDLQNFRKKIIPLYREAEKWLLWKALVVANTPAMAGLGLNIPESGKFKIDFAELEKFASEKEKVETDLMQISQNIKTPVDVIMENNPDLSRDEAMALYEENKTINGQSTGISI